MPQEKRHPPDENENILRYIEEIKSFLLMGVS